MMIAKHLMGLINKYTESQNTFIARGNYAYWFNGKRFEKWCTIPQNWILPPGTNLQIIKADMKSNMIYKNKQFICGPLYAQEVCFKLLDIHIIASLSSHSYSLLRNQLESFGPEMKILPNKPTRSTTNGRFIRYENRLYYFAFNEPTEAYDTIAEKWATIENVSNKKYDDMVLLNELFYAILDLKVVFVYNPK